MAFAYPTYYVGQKGTASPLPASRLDRDTRGVVWVYEPPDPRATYVLGLDPSFGLTGWSRETRREDDIDTNNSAIEIIRVGRGGTPDRQVCEYAAPLDAEDIADVANCLGRIYAGADEDYKQCKVIIEAQPGPGLLTIKRIQSLGYRNLFRWQHLDKATVAQTNSIGWYSSRSTVPILWTRCARHILKGGVKIYSPELIEEMADARMNLNRGTAAAKYGSQDDRLRAFMLAIWAGREWALDNEDEFPEVTNTQQRTIDPQACDMSYDDYMSFAEDLFNSLGDN